VYTTICNACLEGLKQNTIVSFTFFFFLITTDVNLFLFVNLSLVAAESQKKANENKCSSLFTQKAADHWKDHQQEGLLKPAMTVS